MTTDDGLVREAFAALAALFASSIGAADTAHLADLDDPDTGATANAAFTAVIGVGHVFRDRPSTVCLDKLHAAEEAAKAIARLHDDEQAYEVTLHRLWITWYSTLRLSPADTATVRARVEELRFAPEAIERVVAWVSRP
jgi:hypothetical protein